jgi:uncharacterized protein (DUF1015 family)
MADVRPFRGFRYHLPAGEDLAAILTPPYDVITPEAQTAYYERHPLNIIRLELGRDEAGDDALGNRYSRAAALFAQWRLTGDLQLDPAPAVYVYQQEFTAQGVAFTRTSVVARVRLEPWEAGVILPHERTLAKPKSDRLRLLHACAANLSPIMALYDDPKKAVSKLLAKTTKSAPLAQCTDDQGETHALWAITDPATVAKLTAFFAPGQLFIADGHHRYETALTYRDEVAEVVRGLTPDDPANFVLMALVATNDPGLVVLPTHRLVRGLDAARLQALPASFAPYWAVEPLATHSADEVVAALTGAGKDGTVAAVVMTAQGQWLLRLAPASQERLQATGEVEAWQKLDVAAVHELIVDAALGIPREAVATSDQISYTRDAAQALAAVAAGAAQVAILLNPTRPEQVRDVAAAGGRMPQKSTYFYPKLITGMVINPVW